MKSAHTMLLLLILSLLFLGALPAEAASLSLPSPPQFHQTHNNTSSVSDIPPQEMGMIDGTISGVALYLLYAGISLLLILFLVIRIGRRVDPLNRSSNREDNPIIDLAYMLLAMVSAVGVLWLLTVNSTLLIRVDLQGIVGLICCFPSVFFSIFSVGIAVGANRRQVHQSLLEIHLAVAIIAAILLSLLLLMVPAPWELPSLALTYISLITGGVLSAGQFLQYRERYHITTFMPVPALQAGSDDGQKTLVPGADGEALLTEEGIPEAITAQYTDLNPAATGGVASVFSAIRKSDGKQVALKLPLRHDLATGAGFLKEIRIWEHLNHLNIVRLTHVYLLPTLCLEMEYVPCRLTDQIGAISPGRAIEITQGILNGLGYAHLHGYSHCDIKPDNILLTEEGPGGIPKITDWGLSEHAGEKTGIACTAFTPWYAAPEQIAPEQYGLPGPATDLYQVGVLLYLMLTGTHPFAGKDTDTTCRMILNDSPAPLSAHQPDLADLDPVMLKCLAKRPEDRYRSAGALSSDLLKANPDHENRYKKGNQH